jgi:uncharacterized membrane protein YozB (DUF420 family)
MIEEGILGTRADLVMDLVMLALIIILPVMFYSYRRARSGIYAQHRSWQLRLGVVLGITVVLFEIDMQMAGGIYEMAKGGRYYGTRMLDTIIYIHLFFSVTTTLIWLLLLIFSLKRFDNPPQPNRFSQTHRLWGRLGMLDMLMTAITGYILYWYAFVV